MTRRPLAFHHRATDPGGRLASFGDVKWVHCPKCDQAARSDNNGVSCAHCGHRTIQDRSDNLNRWARLANKKERCSHCAEPLEDMDRPTARIIDGKPMVGVRCSHCHEVDDYPATSGWSPQSVPLKRNRLFLVTQVAGETLWVENLTHLEALEDWLGAKVRERGPIRGSTMMARLPRWMKASTNRAKVLRGLAQLRELAERSGIDE